MMTTHRRMPRPSVLLTSFVAAAALVFAVQAVAASACTITWTGSGSEPHKWTEAGNWSPSRLPEATDDVCIPPLDTVEIEGEAGSIQTLESQGTLMLRSGSKLMLTNTAGSTTSNLVQTGGQLGGPGLLQVQRSFEWSGGEQTGPGSTEITPEATLTINSGAAYLESERTLQVDPGAVMTVGASGHLYVGERAAVWNEGTLYADGDEEAGSGIFASQPGGAIENSGVFVRTGIGSFPVSIAFNNEGTVEANFGTLSLEGGGGQSPSAILAGEAEGIVNFAGRTFTFAKGASLGGHIVQSSGIFRGSPLVTGTFEWTAGQQEGAGTTEIASGGALSMKSGDGYLEKEHILQVDTGATMTIGAAGHLYMGEGASVANAGTFEANGDEENGAGIFVSTPGGVFQNTGELTRLGSGSFPVEVPFDNKGTARAASGVLSLGRGGAESSTAEFDGELAGEAPAGTVSFASGTFTLASGVNLSGRIAQTGANLRGPLLVRGSFEWVSGEQEEGGNTVIAPEATLTIRSGTAYLEKERVLQVDAGGVVTMGASGHLYVGESASVANAGTFNADGAEETGGGVFASQPGGVLRNTGVFTRSGSGTFQVGIAFDNEGTVDLALGSLTAQTFNQGTGGVLGIHLGGPLVGSGFSHLNVSGTASIAGRLRVVTENGVHPEPGQRFQILSANPLHGAFSSMEEVGSIGGGWSYTTVYDPNGAELVVGGGPVPTSTTATIAGAGQSGGKILVPEGSVVSAA
jgi:hypothetical protein